MSYSITTGALGSPGLLSSMLYKNNNNIIAHNHQTNNDKSFYFSHSTAAIYAEGKESAMAMGVLKMSTEDIKSKNKGVAVETVHFIADGLWIDYQC